MIKASVDCALGAVGVTTGIASEGRTRVGVEDRGVIVGHTVSIGVGGVEVTLSVIYRGPRRAPGSVVAVAD